MATNEIPRLAVVICTGSYHSPAPYEPFRQALESRGVEAYCPHRLTCDLKELNVGNISNPDFDLGPPLQGYPSEIDDVQAMEKLLDKLINQESKPVLLLGHSSGGIVAAQAATPELQYKPRQANGHQGGVVGIFYVGAFVIPVGKSVHTFFQPKEGPRFTPPFVQFHVS